MGSAYQHSRLGHICFITHMVFKLGIFVCTCVSDQYSSMFLQSSGGSNGPVLSMVGMYISIKYFVSYHEKREEIFISQKMHFWDIVVAPSKTQVILSNIDEMIQYI